MVNRSNIFPCFVRNNRMNIAATNIIFIRQMAEAVPRFVQFSYFNYFVNSKLSAWVSSTSSSRSMLKPITPILAQSIPTKVIKKVIGGVPIIMAGFMSGRTIASKGYQNNPMQGNQFWFSIFPYWNSRITSFINNNAKVFYLITRGCELLNRAGISMVADLIGRVSRNLFPLLLIRTKLVITHGHGLLNRLRLWGRAVVPVSAGLRLNFI